MGPDSCGVWGTQGLLHTEISTPCFIHRFQLKNFAPNTWKTSRTGWYMRVLHPGSIQAGDTIPLMP
jgi:MOSC domain-containing protein YiiM